MTTPPPWVQRSMTPEAEDSADLRWAIETAAALLSRGDHLQGLRWLQHAVQTAHSDGREQRAVDLGRAASELERMAEQRSRPPPAAIPAPSTDMKKTAPYKIAPDDITRAIQPDPRLLEDSRVGYEHEDTDPEIRVPGSTENTLKEARPRPPPPSVDPESTMTSVRSRRSVERTMVMDMSPAELEAVEAMAERSGVIQTDEASRAERGSPPEPSPPSDAPPSPQQVSSIPTTLESPPSPLESMRALRVAVRPGSGNQLDICLLGDGEAPPPGAQEALLVPLGPVREES